MAELREVFEMTTKQVEPDLDSWRDQERRRRRAGRGRKLGAIAVAAAIGLAGIVAAAVVTSDRGSTPAPSVGAEPGGAGQTLSIVDVRSGTGLAFTAPFGAWGFDVTPDGSMIAYADTDERGNEQVFVMDADGTNAMQLTHGVEGVGVVATAHTPAGPVWSPDGSMIAYEREASGAPQIFVVRVSDGVSTQVTHQPQGAVNPGGWAPDGGSLIFSSPDLSINHYSAYSVDLETGKTNLIVADGSTPTPSPDGTRIAFNSWLRPDPLVRLMLANSDGSDRRVIARLNGDDGHQRWSPDSTQIAYVGNTDQDGVGTYVYNLASGATRFVTAGMIEAWIDDEHILVS